MLPRWLRRLEEKFVDPWGNSIVPGWIYCPGVGQTRRGISVRIPCSPTWGSIVYLPEAGEVSGTGDELDGHELVLSAK
jgi:hypothetical protein